MKIFAKVFISIQAFLWDINLSRRVKEKNNLKQLTQLQLPIWRITRPIEEVTEALSMVYSWVEKTKKCLILSIVTASALIHFSKIKECEIVIAVRPFNFTAHAWVEVDRKAIPPSEILTGYREIVRIRFDKIGQTVIPQSHQT